MHDQPYLQAEKKIEETRRSGATKLDLSSMKLTELPETIGQLTQLQQLDLGHDYHWKTYYEKNKLTILPESLANLTQLQSLDLSTNHLTKLPQTLEQLPQLHTLNLSYNQLTSLPEWFGRLARLKFLDLSNNQLMVLPESFGDLMQLEILLLYDNALTELPKSIGQLSKLRTLSIAGNRLKFLIDQIGKLSRLEGLFATKNEIEEIPETIGNLIELKTLVLGEASIADYTYGGKVTSIFYDDESLTAPMPGNKLITVPISIAQLPNLTTLRLEHNPLNPELAKAYKQGIDAVKAYLRAKTNTDKLVKSLHKRKLKVFLCHASQDKHIVHELHEKFITEGWIEPWLDAKKLLPGQDWQAEIKNAVETADNVIIFISNTSVNKDGFIQKELRLAKEIALEKTEGSIFLIPLRLEDCEVPRSLQIYQWANYFGVEKKQTYTNLLESLKVRLKDIQRKESKGGIHDA